MTTVTKRFIERMGGRVDRSAGIIRGVKLLGPKSRNKRTYSHRAMREATSKYNGTKVYLDHPEREQMGADRPFARWVGVVENAEFRGGCIYGDIRLRKQSEHFDALMEAAEEFNGFFGMSHVADGESHFDHGEEVVESIREVFSVDIVTEPATASGLFESHGLPGADDQRARLQAELTELLRVAVGALSDALKLQAQQKPARSSRAVNSLPDPEEGDFDGMFESVRRPTYTRDELHRFAQKLRGGPDDFSFTEPGSFSRRYR